MPSRRWSCQFSLRIRLSSDTSASCFDSPAQNDSNAFFSSRLGPIRGKPRFVAIDIVRLLVRFPRQGAQDSEAGSRQKPGALAFFKVVARVRKSVHLDANYGYSVPPSTPDALAIPAQSGVLGARD